MICKVEGCGKEIKPGGSAHFWKAHGMTVQEYYDKYEKQPGEGKCIGKCGENGEPNDTKFLGLRLGYSKYCCHSCAVNDPEVIQRRLETFKKTMMDTYGVENPQQIPSVREKTLNTCNDRYGTPYAIAAPETQEKIRQVQKSKDTQYEGLIKLDDAFDTYGTGWYLKRDELKIEIIMKGRYGFISEDDIQKILDYQNSEWSLSIKESKLTTLIQSLTGTLPLRHNREIIKPYELDIVLPDLKIAVEYNGLYWHSIQRKLSNKEYHLMKSKLCKEKGYRLIHIYEFEDFEQQCELLTALIRDERDLYDPRDCNKNSLLITDETVPELIYNSKFHTIYGVGKLY